MKKNLILLTFLFFISILTLGCAAKTDSGNTEDISLASNSLDDYDDTPTIYDPWEGFNRAMFKFNDVLLLGVIKPVHKGYQFIVPQTLRNGFSNFTHNLTAPNRIINFILQLDFASAGVEFAKFMANTMTTLGFGDPASLNEPLLPYNEMGTDFGITLAKWGVPEGPYLVLPFFGPRNVRDTFSIAADVVISPDFYFMPFYFTFLKAGLSFNDMYKIYDPYEQITKIAIEPYSAVRSAIVTQRRQHVAR